MVFCYGSPSKRIYPKTGLGLPVKTIKRLKNLTRSFLKMATKLVSEKYLSCSTNKFIIGLLISFSQEKVGYIILTKMLYLNFRNRSSCVLFVHHNAEIQGFQVTCQDLQLPPSRKKKTHSYLSNNIPKQSCNFNAKRPVSP